MPGAGLTVVRPRTDLAIQAQDAEAVDLLGLDVIDVYLNASVGWSGVPEAAWDFRIGGFQVLREWLSYRDSRILGRALTIAEVRQFTHRATADRSRAVGFALARQLRRDDASPHRERLGCRSGPAAARRASRPTFLRPLGRSSIRDMTRV